jgi:long-chain acyl-CoA synthetase
METVAEALFRRATGRPTHPAIVAADRSASLTYGELWERSRAAADYFRAQGVQPGDHVLLSAESAPEFAIAYFAVHLARGVAVPVDSGMPPSRLEELTQRVRPKLIVGNASVLSNLPGSNAVALEALSKLPPAGPGVGQFGEGRDLADLLFTTGTTGRPKGVSLSHGNIAAAARHINSVIGNAENDVEVVPLPLNHSFGLMRLRCNVLAGGTIVLCRGFRMPGEIFTALAQHAATGLVGVPAGFALLLRFGQEGLGSLCDQLRYIEIGSAAMPLAHKRSLMALLPRTAIWMHYGLTEASRSAFIELHRDSDHLDTIGKPSPGVQVSVREENGQQVAIGQQGMLWLRGDAVALGYFDDPELTRKIFQDGWVCTGDVASVDSHGFIRLHGRRDDMINVGGYNVAPDEVERTLCNHPSIEDAACVAIADPKGISGNAVKAYVVGRDGQTAPSDRELSTWLAQRLEHYRIPARYEWIAAIPRTASGKIQRASLRSAQDPTASEPEQP